jgi:hypothetical protein
MESRSFRFSIRSLAALGGLLFVAVAGCSSDEAGPVANSGNTATVARAEIAFENPSLAPVSIRGVACLGGTIAVCGDAGFVALLTGGTWTTVNTGAPVTLNAVWGTSPTDVYFAGNTGCFLHWDGTRITPIDAGPDDWISMWGSSSDDIWLLSYSSLLHWQGSTSTYYRYSQLPVGLLYQDIGGSAADNVYVAGTSGLMRWDGSSWSAVVTGAGATDLNSVIAIDDEVFVAGDDFLLLHFDGTAWSSFTATGASFQEFTVVVGARTNNVFALGRDRLMYRWNGTAWSDVTDTLFPTYHDFLSACTGVGGNGIVAGGTPHSPGPNLARFDGLAWTPLTQSSVALVDYLDVWTRNADNAVAVGRSGAMVQRTAAGWQDVTHGLTTEDLNGVWGSGPSDIYAVGDEGTVLHGDGAGWSLVNTGLGVEDLYDAGGNGPENVWILGSYTLWHWDGATWENRWSELPDTLASYESIYVAPDGDVFIAGYDMLHHDGAAWQRIPVKSLYGGAIITDLWGTSSANVWLAGYPGVFRWDGTSIELRWASDIFGNPVAVTGRGANNVVVGTTGELVQFANGIPTPIPFTNGDSDISGASTGTDGTAYFVGENGLIARVE